MKKYFIGMIVLSILLMMNGPFVQAKGTNGKVGINQEKTMSMKNHSKASINKTNKEKHNVSYSSKKNKRLDGKDKAVKRHLDGKEKAIERRLEGKENVIQRRTENNSNAGYRGHRGHHKRNLNSSDSTKKHINRGNIINSKTNSGNNLKQEKNKRYVKQNGIKNKSARVAK